MLTYAPNSFMGVNYNSPTVQNMIQQNGMVQQLPFSTTPNIGNIGGLGYNNQYYNQALNGGYYSGNYNYYNPQQIMRQMEEERKAQEAMVRNNIEVQKIKARIHNMYLGIETNEEFLETYYNPNTYSEIQKDIDDYEEMVRISAMSYDPSSQVRMNQTAINNYARISAEIRANHPVDQSFVDYMNTAGDLYREAVINQNARELRKNIGNMYDKDAYSQLTNMHRQSSFASLRQAVTVDDLSIGLPDHLRRSQSYQDKKNQFLSFITQNDVRNQGGV